MTKKEKQARIRELGRIAYDPYARIEQPTAADWRKAYDALKELCELEPEEGVYPNTLGYLCYYGRHTGGERRYEEARAWFEKGAALRNIESTYKLADMLADGLGGPVDKERAEKMYLFIYLYCRDQFEGGLKESKFADTALRMGRLFHEGKIPEKDDLEALGYLLEAKYAIEWRKQYEHYGDGTVEKNIRRLIDECEKPDEEILKREQYGLSLGRVPNHLMPCDEVRMTVDIAVDDRGVARLEFRRKRKDGKKPNRILWSVAPAMRCFMTDSVVLYGADIRQIWNKNPGEPIVCDRYDHDEKTDTHLFYLEGELQAKLLGGYYVLPMEEFWMTEMRDHPEAGSGVTQ